MSEKSLSAPETITVHAIGYIRSPHSDPERTPIQPVFCEGIEGRAEILPAYEEGLQDIEGFSHLVVLYHLHRTETISLKVKPFLQDQTHGVFATRHPCRPNRIGLSVLRLIRREGNLLILGDLDILDGTPILDIKPFVNKFDSRDNTRDGWIGGVSDEKAQIRGRRGAATKEQR